MGVDLHRERARERGVDGGDVALPLTPSGLPLALDSQLGRTDRHQHDALPVLGVVVDGLASSNYNPRCMIQTELDVLRDVSERLTSSGIAFMLTGSMAMNYYAQPRMTRDIGKI